MLEFVFSSCFQNLILHENKSSFPFKQEYVAEQKIFKAEEKQKEDKDDDWIKAYIKGKEMMADLTREKDADTNRWVQGCFSLQFCSVTNITLSCYATKIRTSMQASFL